MNRLHNLDYLRGLAAFGIMIFHYLTWTNGEFNAESVIARIGIYGVSIFYVLSGLTLNHVYYQKMEFNVQSLLMFFKKRVFRIFPLLWAVTIISILILQTRPNFLNVFLNLTGLFGFVRWDKYFAVGAWSIGNELVFYIFFPFFIYFSKAKKVFFFLLCSALLAMYIYFAFSNLNTDVSLSSQWKNYVNPLNQVFLFLAGFLMPMVFTKTKISNLKNAALIVTGLLIFIYLPVQGDSIHLVTGLNRLIFTFCCLLVCFGFYKTNIQLNVVLHRFLKFLGEGSYSVYLIHLFIFKLINSSLKHVNQNLFAFSNALIITFSIIFTLLFSYFSYEYFEKFFIKLGNKKRVAV
jgi:exopolysaccharide production protein ExoZ